MPVTARTWVEGEIATAAKLNTIRDDLLDIDAVAGVKSVQYGSVTLGNGVTTNNATITSVNTAKSVLHFLGNSIESGSSVSDGFVRLALASNTSVTATRATGNNVCIVNFCIIEYM